MTERKRAFWLNMTEKILNSTTKSITSSYALGAMFEICPPNSARKPFLLKESKKTKGKAVSRILSPPCGVGSSFF